MTRHRHIFLYIGLLTLIGCSSSDSGSKEQDEPEIGVFLDSRVSGLTYTSDSFSGKTNARGEFEYRGGEMVTFSIGEITLGSAPGGALVTPLTLVPDARTLQDTKVANIARLLQTLDTDDNTANGIQLNDSVESATRDVRLDLNSTDFGRSTSLTTLLARLNKSALIEEEQAQNHLSNTLRGQSRWGAIALGSGRWRSLDSLSQWGGMQWGVEPWQNF